MTAFVWPFFVNFPPENYSTKLSSGGSKPLEEQSNNKELKCSFFLDFPLKRKVKNIKEH